MAALDIGFMVASMPAPFLLLGVALGARPLPLLDVAPDAHCLGLLEITLNGLFLSDSFKTFGWSLSRLARGRFLSTLAS